MYVFLEQTENKKITYHLYELENKDFGNKIIIPKGRTSLCGKHPTDNAKLLELGDFFKSDKIDKIIADTNKKLEEEYLKNKILGETEPEYLNDSNICMDCKANLGR